MRKTQKKRNRVIGRLLGTALSLWGGVIVIHQVPIHFWYGILLTLISALLILLFWR